MFEESVSAEMPSLVEAQQGFDDEQLIDFILERFHERHREQLEVLIPLARKVETVHSDQELCPVGLAQHLENMSEELEQHMFKEENILFPMIRRGQGISAVGPISMMKYEHEQHVEEIGMLERKARGLILPEFACNSWRRLYEGISEFVRDLKAHIELENNVLFARQAR